MITAGTIILKDLVQPMKGLFVQNKADIGKLVQASLSDGDLLVKSTGIQMVNDMVQYFDQADWAPLQMLLPPILQVSEVRFHACALKSMC